MQLIGHWLVPYESLFWVRSKNEISNERQNLFDYDEATIGRAKELNAEFSVVCRSVSEAIIAKAAGAKFIVCNTHEAKEIADLAQFYLFDSKIACVINSEDELEILAKFGVDAAIFRQGIIGGNF